MTDQELASGIAEGREEALEELVERFHKPIFRYLWQTCGSKEDAEDLATQTLLKVKASIRGFKGKGTLRAWVFQVAYRELLMFRRRQKIARLLHPKASEQVQPPSNDAIVIAEALGKIPAGQRAAFLLTEVEGLSVEEAAAALGVAKGTIKSRCHSARQRLRQFLGSTYGESHAEPVID